MNNIINCYFCGLPNKDPGNGIIKCQTCSNEYQLVLSGAETAQIYIDSYHVVLNLRSPCTSVYDVRSNQEIIIPGLDLSPSNLLEKIKTLMLLS